METSGKRASTVRLNHLTCENKSCHVRGLGWEGRCGCTSNSCSPEGRAACRIAEILEDCSFAMEKSRRRNLRESRPSGIRGGTATGNLLQSALHQGNELERKEEEAFYTVKLVQTEYNTVTIRQTKKRSCPARRLHPGGPRRLRCCSTRWSPFSCTEMKVHCSLKPKYQCSIDFLPYDDVGGVNSANRPVTWQVCTSSHELEVTFSAHAHPALPPSSLFSRSTPVQW